jgi:Uma2 family endonuclease
MVFRDMEFVPPADLADRNSSRPHYEWVRGRYYPKVSPKWAHGLLQVRVAFLLSLWAEGRGAVASETDTNVTPKRGDTRRYLPDVGYWSYRRLREASERAKPVPEIPPDLVVEIISPSQSRRYLAAKVLAYVAAGSTAAIVVDDKRRHIVIHEAGGERTLSGAQPFEHPAFPGLQIVPNAIFSVLDLP